MLERKGTMKIARKAPAQHTYEACVAAGYEFTYSQRGVPMGHYQHGGSPRMWSSICWFGKGQYYKVFLNGNGIGCARTVAGVLQLTEPLIKELTCAIPAPSA